MEALFDPPYRTGLCMMISLKKLKRQHWMHLPPSSSLTHSPKAPPSFITGLPQALSRSCKFKNWYNFHMSLAYVTLKMLHWNCANNLIQILTLVDTQFAHHHYCLESEFNKHVAFWCSFPHVQNQDVIFSYQSFDKFWIILFYIEVWRLLDWHAGFHSSWWFGSSCHFVAHNWEQTSCWSIVGCLPGREYHNTLHTSFSCRGD